jgi:DNA-binding MarR family transcriptional regulator
MECENNPELSVQSCLEGIGIFLLSDWDVLVFVYRHGASLTSTDQIARLLGYQSAVVGGALDRLEFGNFFWPISAVYSGPPWDVVV